MASGRVTEMGPEDCPTPRRWNRRIPVRPYAINDLRPVPLDAAGKAW